MRRLWLQQVPGPAFRELVTAQGHASQATVCFDPLHVVRVCTDALNTVRHDLWQQLRRLPDPDETAELFDRWCARVQRSR